jgi:hypothetical protein
MTKILSYLKEETADARQAARWPFYALLVCLAALAIRFPGEWDSDTVEQHAQMLAGSYRDWHPPVFAAFWRLVNSAWNGLTGMRVTGSGVIYIVHAAMLWGGLALILRAARPFLLSFVGLPRWKPALFSGAILFFGLFEMVPMTRFVFKDTAMMAGYVPALGLMLNFPKSVPGKALVCPVCLLLLFYGTAVRHNAIFALMPMLALLLLRIRPGLRLRLLAAGLLAIWAALLFGVNQINYGLLKAEKQYPLQEIIFTDFWKLNYKTGTFDLPPLPAGRSWAPLTGDVFFRFYNEAPVYIQRSFTFINEYYAGQGGLVLRHDFSEDPRAFDELRSAWVDKIISQFGAYVGIHKRIFVDLLREYSFMGLTGALYFAAGLLLVASGLVLLIRKKGGEPAPYLVALSGLLYVLPYAAAVPDIQRRYLFWFFFAVAFGLSWVLASLLRGRAAAVVRGVPTPPCAPGSTCDMRDRGYE